MILEQYDMYGNRYLSFEGMSKGVACRYIEFRHLDENVVAKKRKEYRRIYDIPGEDVPQEERWKVKEGVGRPRHGFVKWLVLKGLMDGQFTLEEIEDAKKGFVPVGYDVHHIVPLSCGGNNRHTNLVLIHKKVHRALHTVWLDQARSFIQKGDSQKFYENGEKTIIRIPIMPYVMSFENTPIYLRELIIEAERQKTARSLAKQKISDAKVKDIQTPHMRSAYSRN